MIGITYNRLFSQKKSQKNKIGLAAIAISALLLISSVSGQSFATQTSHPASNADTLMYVVNEGGNSVSIFDPRSCSQVDIGKGRGIFIEPGNDLWNPRGMTFDANGNAYVSSFSRGTVLQYDSHGDFIKVFVNDKRLSYPQGMTFDTEGNLYVASTGNDKVIRYDESGNYIDDFVAISSGGLKGPEDVKFGPEGLFYVSSGKTDEILRYDGESGAFVDVFADGRAWLKLPADMVFSADGTRLYVASSDNNRVNIYGTSSTNNYLGGIDAGAGYGVGSVDIGPDGLAYIPSFFGNNVDTFDVNTLNKVGKCIPISQGLSRPITILFHATISADDPPVADAGPDMTVKSGDTITLDGTNSFDPQSRAISYVWTDMTAAKLENANSDAPRFTIPTVFEFQLVVSAGGQYSQPDTVRVTVLP